MSMLSPWALGGRRQLRSLGRHIYFQYRSSSVAAQSPPPPSTGPRSRTAQPKRPEVSTKSHNVSTLSQALLTPADYIDISQCMACRITFPGVTQPDHGFPYGFVHRENPPGQNHKVHAEPVPFPPHSRGFLYYQTDPQAGPLEGSVRFRLTPDNSPAAFPAGKDLRAPHGLPWQIALSQVASRALYAPVGAQLVADALVTPAQLTRCGAAFASHARAIRAPEYTLFRLVSTFPINFAHPLTLNVAGADLHKLDLNLVFRASVARIHQHHPLWTGSAIAQFEPSTLDPQRRVLHLRIVKILTPAALNVDPALFGGRHVLPEEGQLVRVPDRDGASRLWAYDIDGSEPDVAAPFRVLWENSGLPPAVSSNQAKGRRPKSGRVQSIVYGKMKSHH